MSRGYGRVHREILATMDADPERLFSVRELICGDEYGEVSYTARKSFERAIRKLWFAGEIWRAHWFYHTDATCATRYCHSELAILIAWRDRHARHVRLWSENPDHLKYRDESVRALAEFEAEIEAFRPGQHLDGLSDTDNHFGTLASLTTV